MRELSLAIIFVLFANYSYARCNKTNHAPVELGTYYANTEELEGQELKAALNGIIKGHKKYSYTPCVWAMLKEADEDPNNVNNVIEI